MRIYLSGTDREYDLQCLSLLFFPGSDFSSDDGKELSVTVEGNTATAVFKLGENEYTATAEVRDEFDSSRLAVKRCAYDAMSEATGITSPWGLLTGIKSALYYGTLKEAHGDNARKVFSERYLVRDDKIDLCEKILETRKSAVQMCQKDTCSVYISVPFCPSRCSYCSFVSSATSAEGRFLDPYVDRLVEEIEQKARIVRERGLKVLSLYIGGGTPTVLSDEQLDRILSAYEKHFSYDNIKEITVEAGRPDTITSKKLRTLKTHGVNRISVNPQTLNDKVLEVIGRKHTSEQFFDAYELAAKENFRINVDIIAGLPTDTFESFEKTVVGVSALDPANVTLHTLYVKRAADIHSLNPAAEKANGELAGKMVGFAENYLDEKGYLPYYLYRQKNTVGNHENVGYAKPWRECLYNIFMMDDIQTVIGIGANAVSKVVHDGGHIERFANTKFAYNYLKEDFKPISFE